MNIFGVTKAIFKFQLFTPTNNHKIVGVENLEIGVLGGNLKIPSVAPFVLS